ncbi:hypothetical protein EU803_00570 [Loktanella sp. IMCC34160]|nr:hypothetical protein EU803_00570 [Loktanella sp. IMCC34160]
MRIKSTLGLVSKLTFFVFVFVPALVGGYYYFAIASDQYETEIRLVVRSIGLQTAQEEGGDRVTMLGGAAVVQDAHILVNYLSSVDVVKDLQDDVDLRAAFSREGVDEFSRLEPDATMEELHSYWKQQTTSYVDGPSGIIQFSVRAFSPEDAVLISEAAIRRAAGLIEELSEEAKRSLLERSRRELDAAKAAYVASLNDLRDLQNEAGILNPLTEAGVSTELIATLFMEKLEAEVELEVLRNSGASNSPLMTQLYNRIDTLGSRIDEQRQQMAGVQQDGGELSAFFARINSLETERLLAESLYRSASRNFDLAKSTTERQSTFVSVFSPPILPTSPNHPQRFALWIILVSCLLAVWATLVLVLASIDDHRS